jgi:hypothetical protein
MSGVSEDQSIQSLDLTQPYPSSTGNSQTGLWVAVIGVVMCLLAVACAIAIFGLGWRSLTLVQEVSATATAQAQHDSATAAVRDATATAQAQIVLPVTRLPPVPEIHSFRELGQQCGTGVE